MTGLLYSSHCFVLSLVLPNQQLCALSYAHSSTLNMQAADHSKILLPIHQTTHCHISEDIIYIAKSPPVLQKQILQHDKECLAYSLGHVAVVSLRHLSDWRLGQNMHQFQT